MVSEKGSVPAPAARGGSVAAPRPTTSTHLAQTWSRNLGSRVAIVLLLLAAPVVSAALFWGSWGWMAASVAVAVVELATLRHAQRFSARLWRSVGVGSRSRRERATESLYVVSAVAGLAFLVLAILSVV